MKAWTVVGYTFKADTYCLDCMRTIVQREMPDPRPVPSMSVEVELDEWARQIGLDRYIEESFDTDDFPKVIFSVDAEATERCGSCNTLID